MSFASQTSQFGAPNPVSGLLRGGPLVAGVEVSVLQSESHNFTSDITRIALESGAQVTDHVIVQPAEVSVVFSLTNTGGGSDAARDAFETFLRLQSEREPVELVTEHHVYENMVIVNVAPMHQAPYKGTLNFSLRLQQVNFVELESVGREPQTLAGDTAKTGAGATNAGRQDPVAVSANRPVSKQIQAAQAASGR